MMYISYVCFARLLILCYCYCYCLIIYVERLRAGKKNVKMFPCPICRSKFTLKSNQDIAEMPGDCFIKNMLEIKENQEKACEIPQISSQA